MWNGVHRPVDDGVYYDGGGVIYGDPRYVACEPRECYTWRRDRFDERGHHANDGFMRWDEERERGFGYAREVSFHPPNPTRHHVACQTAHVAELLPLHLAWRIGGRARGPVTARGGRGRVQRTRCKTIAVNRTIEDREKQREKYREIGIRGFKSLTFRRDDKGKHGRREKSSNVHRGSAEKTTRHHDKKRKYGGPSSATFAGSAADQHDNKRAVESVVVKVKKVEASERPCSAVEAGSEKEKVTDCFFVTPAEIIPPNEWPSSANKAGSRDNVGSGATSIKQSGKNQEKGDGVETTPTVNKNEERAPSATDDLLDDFDNYEFLDPPPTPGGSIQWPELF